MAPKARMATVEDSRFLAEMMYESTLAGVGRGLFDPALAGSGVAPIDFNEALLLAGASNWGQIEDFFVLEAAAGPLAGAASAYLSDRSDRRPLTAEGFEAVVDRLGWPRDRAQAFWRSYVRLFGLFGDAPALAQPARYVIEYVAVPASFRGRGYAQILLDAHLRRARALGHGEVAVSAMLGNEPALRAYRRCGFREHDRLGPERFAGAFPGMVRLVRDLSLCSAAETDAALHSTSRPG